MSTTTLETRNPDDVGYVAWLLNRLSAVALVLLLAIHLGVQLYPQYGFDAVYEWGIYRSLLDATLALVLLHGFLGVRATLLELSTSDVTKRAVIWTVGLVFLGFFAFRIFG